MIHGSQAWGTGARPQEETEKEEQRITAQFSKRLEGERLPSAERSGLSSLESYIQLEWESRQIISICHQQTRPKATARRCIILKGSDGENSETSRRREEYGKNTGKGNRLFFLHLDLRTQADADIYQGSHYPRPYDKFKTIWFEKIEIIQSMLSKLKGDKPESEKETKEHFYITHWSEGLEGREDYIELSESSKVSEFVGLKRR